MKTTCHSIFIILLLFIFSGCYERNIKTRTEIFTDGSCERTVSAEGDSSDIYDSTFPIPISAWEVTFQDVEGEPDFIAKRGFASVSELNAYYQSVPSGDFRVPVEVSLKKRFRWFNTTFRYIETYKAWNSYINPPIEEYLTEHDLKVYAETGNSDTLRIDKKMELWWMENLIEALFGSLVSVSDSLQLQELTPEKLLEKKRDLRNALYKVDIIGDSVETILPILQKIFKSDEVARLKSPLEQSLNQIEKTWELFVLTGSTDYENEVVMPGLIVATNATGIEGNSVRWKMTGEQYAFKDYQMWVESRIVNQWALWVTIGLCFILLVTGIGFALKKR